MTSAFIPHADRLRCVYSYLYSKKTLIFHFAGCDVYIVQMCVTMCQLLRKFAGVFCSKWGSCFPVSRYVFNTIIVVVVCSCVCVHLHRHGFVYLNESLHVRT